ncbi:hypothetical protein D3C74_368800 [compost metagenome]
MFCGITGNICSLHISSCLEQAIDGDTQRVIPTSIVGYTTHGPFIAQHRIFIIRSDERIRPIQTPVRPPCLRNAARSCALLSCISPVHTIQTHQICKFRLGSRFKRTCIEPTFFQCSLHSLRKLQLKRLRTDRSFQVKSP